MIIELFKLITTITVFINLVINCKNFYHTLTKCAGDAKVRSGSFLKKIAIVAFSVNKQIPWSKNLKTIEKYQIQEIAIKNKNFAAR